MSEIKGVTAQSLASESETKLFSGFEAAGHLEQMYGVTSEGEKRALGKNGRVVIKFAFDDNGELKATAVEPTPPEDEEAAQTPPAAAEKNEPEQPTPAENSEEVDIKALKQRIQSLEQQLGEERQTFEERFKSLDRKFDALIELIELMLEKQGVKKPADEEPAASETSDTSDRPRPRQDMVKFPDDEGEIVEGVVEDYFKKDDTEYAKVIGRNKKGNPISKEIPLDEFLALQKGKTPSPDDAKEPTTSKPEETKKPARAIVLSDSERQVVENYAKRPESPIKWNFKPGDNVYAKVNDVLVAGWTIQSIDEETGKAVLLQEAIKDSPDKIIEATLDELNQWQWEALPEDKRHKLLEKSIQEANASEAAKTKLEEGETVERTIVKEPGEKTSPDEEPNEKDEEPANKSWKDRLFIKPWTRAKNWAYNVRNRDNSEIVEIEEKSWTRKRLAGLVAGSLVVGAVAGILIYELFEHYVHVKTGVPGRRAIGDGGPRWIPPKGPVPSGQHLEFYNGSRGNHAFGIDLPRGAHLEPNGAPVGQGKYDIIGPNGQHWADNVTFKANSAPSDTTLEQLSKRKNIVIKLGKLLFNDQDGGPGPSGWVTHRAASIRLK